MDRLVLKLYVGGLINAEYHCVSEVRQTALLLLRRTSDIQRNAVDPEPFSVEVGIAGEPLVEYVLKDGRMVVNPAWDVSQ